MFLSFAGQKFHEILKLAQRALLTTFTPAQKTQEYLITLDRLLTEDLSNLSSTLHRIKNLSLQNNTDEIIELFGSDYIQLASVFFKLPLIF